MHRKQELQKLGLKIVYINPYFDPAVPSGGNRKAKEMCTRLAEEFGSDFELIIARGKILVGIKDAVVHEVEYKQKSIPSKISAYLQIGKILDSLPRSIVIMESVPIPFGALKKHIHFQAIWDLRYFTDNVSWLYRLKYTWPLKREWKKSQYLITCSDFTKSELEKYCARRPEDIITSYFGFDEKLLNTTTTLPQKDFDILSVGHFEKRKNYENLIRAIAIADKNLKVKLIGVDNGLKVSLENLGKELGIKNLELFTLNDDVKLWDYYRRARLFVFPSRYEGFGMPLIEALALGTPVACSNISVFREIGADLPLYFNQENPEDMARVIKKSLGENRVPSREEVRKTLHKFSWDEVYRNLVDDVIAFSEK